MDFIAEELSRSTLVNIMAQYRPYYKATSEGYYEEISGRIIPTEYTAVVAHARDRELERLPLDAHMLAGSDLDGSAP